MIQDSFLIHEGNIDYGDGSKTIIYQYAPTNIPNFVQAERTLMDSILENSIIRHNANLLKYKQMIKSDYLNHNVSRGNTAKDLVTVGFDQLEVCSILEEWDNELQRKV